jgi:hypothetical protein
MIALDKFGWQEDVCFECTHVLKRGEKGRRIMLRYCISVVLGIQNDKNKQQSDRVP